MNGQMVELEPAWSKRLEVVGSELFLRYRKRLLQPGISLEIWRDYPGLSLPDVWLRVHVARQIIRDGDDFAALAAIHQGRWQRPGCRAGEERVGAARVDHVSRLLVTIGGALFMIFCGLSLAVALSGGSGTQGHGLFLALLSGVALAAVRRRVRMAERGDAR